MEHFIRICSSNQLINILKVLFSRVLCELKIIKFQGKQSMNWNQTEGWIEKSFVEKKTVIRSPKIDTIFVPCVKYSFVTNGKLFSGNLCLYFFSPQSTINNHSFF